jgi:trehalose synthase
MRSMREAKVTPTIADRFEAIIGGDRYSQFSQLADTTRERFLGRTIWNINSTETGGGVAEMLRGLVATAMGLGIDTRWLVVDGEPEFFAITKRIHNCVHGSPGDGGPLGDAEHRRYESVVGVNRERLHQLVSPGDIVILHDPQTAGMVEMAKETGAHVVWRCHIGRDVANESTQLAWDFLSPYVVKADALVFSRAEYIAQSLSAGRTLVLPPAIDPFAVKNIHFDHQTVVSILSAVGLVTPPKDTGPAIFPKGGSTGTVTRQAKIVREGGPLDPATPLVVQVSRWDRLKDMYGVMMAFAEKVATDPATGEAHLALVGPDVDGVSDDPEGLEVLQECVTAWHALPVEQRKRVSLVSLPMFDVDENAAVVNAIQRHASIVAQKSLVEGFGLTVSEAMWKARPVVASSVGGILDQISSGQNGVLVAPEDLDAFAAALTRLLTDAAESRRLGQAARERVLDQFLPDRQLTQWAQLFAAMTTAQRATG